MLTIEHDGKLLPGVHARIFVVSTKDLQEAIEGATHALTIVRDWMELHPAIAVVSIHFDSYDDLAAVAKARHMNDDAGRLWLSVMGQVTYSTVATVTYDDSNNDDPTNGSEEP